MMKSIKSKLALSLCLMFAVLFSGGFAVSSASAAQDAEQTFRGSGGEFSYTRTYEYARKEVLYKSIIPGALPKYGDNNNYKCAPLAGAVIAAYYDRTYSEMIPNFKSATVFGSIVMWTSQSTVINELITTLGSAMSTTTSGTTMSNFFNGFTSYTQSAIGHTPTYTNVMNGAYVNHSLIYSILNQGIPLALFFTGYDYVMDGNFVEGTNEDTMTFRSGYSNHTSAVYGFEKINYYDSSDTLTNTLEFLYVSFGDGSIGRFSCGANNIVGMYSVAV